MKVWVVEESLGGEPQSRKLCKDKQVARKVAYDWAMENPHSKFTGDVEDISYNCGMSVTIDVYEQEVIEE